MKLGLRKAEARSVLTFITIAGYVVVAVVSIIKDPSKIDNVLSTMSSLMLMAYGYYFASKTLEKK